MPGSVSVAPSSAQSREGQDHVQRQGEIGDQAPGAVKHDHEGEDKGKADRAGDEAHLNGVAAEIGPDAFVPRSTLSGAGSAPARSITAKSCAVRGGEAAADLTRAAGNRLADHRRAQHLAVEHDRERLADIGAGDVGKAARPLGIEPKRDDRLAGLLVESGGGMDQPVAFQHGPAPDGIELVAAPFGARQQLDPGRQSRAALQPDRLALSSRR